MTERKRGRRPKPDTERLDAVIGIRFTDDEAQALFALARRLGRDLSPLLRDRALALLNSCNTETESPSLAPAAALP